MAVFRVLLMVVYLENDVLSEKSGLAHRFSEGIDVRLLLGESIHGAHGCASCVVELNPSSQSTSRQATRSENG
jgi:hypothetical protein